MPSRYAAGILSILSLVAVSAYGQAASGPAAAPMAPAPKAEAPAKSSAGDAETGLAAVYSDKLHGRRTASGQRYDRNQLTAAHKTLPFGTQVKVTNVKNNKSVVVRINDRGPTQAGRVLDLSPHAAKSLGISPRGMADVRVEVAQAAAAKK